MAPNKCYYPDWEGGYTVGEHSWDKEGWCSTCGDYDWNMDERPWDRFTRYELLKKVKQLTAATVNWQKELTDCRKERANMQGVIDQLRRELFEWTNRYGDFHN